MIFEIDLTPEEELLPKTKSPPYNLCTKTQLKMHDLNTVEEPVAVFCDGLYRAMLYRMEDAYHDSIEDYYRPKIYPFTKENLMKSLKRIRVNKQGYLKLIHPKNLNRHEKKMVKLEDLENKVLEKFTQDNLEVFDIEFKRLRLVDAIATLNAYVVSLEI